MANPTPGEIEYAYNRMYIVVDPTFPAGPPTYRISNPDEIGGGTGGGGTGATYDFDGIEPIEVDMTPGAGSNPTIVETSMDISKLDDR